VKTSDSGLDHIEQSEGIRYTAYLDTGGVWTIGVGHTGPEVIKGLRATDEQVRAWLEEDVLEAEDAVNRLVKVELTQNQFDMLVSFVFNVGEGQFKRSTMLRLLNQGDYEGAANELPKWKFDNGKMIQGLLNRRLEEQKIFLA
jgi:lysozyme